MMSQVKVMMGHVTAGIAKDDSHVLLHVMPEDEKVPLTNSFVPVAILQVCNRKHK